MPLVMCSGSDVAVVVDPESAGGGTAAASASRHLSAIAWACKDSATRAPWSLAATINPHDMYTRSADDADDARALSTTEESALIPEATTSPQVTPSADELLGQSGICATTDPGTSSSSSS